jgi:hypothetical protein
MGSNYIQNLHAGVNNTDAVNVGQLNSTVAAASGSLNLQTVTNNGNTTSNGIVVNGSSTFGNDLHITGDLYVQGTEYITITEVVSGNELIGGVLDVTSNTLLGHSNTTTTTVSGFLTVGNNATFNQNVTIDGTLDMTNGQINNLASGTLASDAVNLGQVESLIASASGAETLAQILTKGNTSGGTQIDMQGAKVVNVGTPTVSGDVANKGYVDTVIAASGASIQQGTIVGGTFAGNPKTVAVVFGTAFADTTYSITISSESQRIWTFSNKTVSGFLINANANRAFSENVDWVAVKK